MDFDSPKDLMKNIENFFSGSPQSPSFLPLARRLMKKEKVASAAHPMVSTKGLSCVLSDCFDSPTTTLAADLSENFHIKESIQSSNRLLEGFSPSLPMEKTDEHTLAKKVSPLTDPYMSLTSNAFQKPPMIFSDSARSSRTASTASTASLNTVSSASSIESSVTTIFAKPQLPKKTLSRSKTTFADFSRLTHSLSTSALDLRRKKSLSTNETHGTTDDLMKRLLNNINDSDISFEDPEKSSDDLERFCVTSPITQRTIAASEFTGLNKRDIGSPLQKKPVRSKVRRTHSMFYSKKEITETTKTFADACPSDPDISLNINDSLLEKSKIDVFYIKNDLIPRINVDTLCKILDGHYREFYNDITVVDCRFEYEYKGGHINGAVNVSSQQELEEKFLQDRNFKKDKSKLIVFHCEFSSYRGPLMASHLRTCDRNINQDNYPRLDYPDILVLEGGYKSFFDCQPNRCFPQKYVEMSDYNHKTTCEKELTRFRRDLKRASSLSSLSFTASLNQQTSGTTTTATMTLSSRGIHRRTATSTGVMSNRRPSLKSQSLDFSRVSLPSLDSKLEVSGNDENKPPASLDFGFKFPMKADALNSPDELKDLQLQRSGLIKKKLSRSFTTVNM